MHPDSHHPYYSLPWLERLAVHVAGYKDSLDRGDRRAADRALREATLHRLRDMRSRLEESILQCTRREVSSTHIASLERIVRHLNRVIERIEASDTRIEASDDHAKVDDAKANFLHEAHLAVFEQAEALVKHFEEPDIHHDRLPHVEADLKELEDRLDKKAMLYRQMT